MNKEKTFVMLKPSAVTRGLIGNVISRFENKGLKIVGLKMHAITQTEAEQLYSIHKGKPFYPILVEYITSAPVVAMVIEGLDAVKVVRSMIGATNPKEAQAGTIRGDMAMDTTKNVIHASDSTENAQIEMKIFFKPENLTNYKRADEDWL
ncbi:MAG: nucleoside-diphosphate kinase [Candidatus Bathyarchaeia archaeon]|jgi:nucleoside-diphosphate kinase